jgi:hypothetical protein
MVSSVTESNQVADPASVNHVATTAQPVAPSTAFLRLAMQYRCSHGLRATRLDRPLKHTALTIEIRPFAKSAFSDPETQRSKKSSREPSRGGQR